MNKQTTQLKQNGAMHNFQTVRRIMYSAVLFELRRLFAHKTAQFF
jgi:hypothetical protein